MTATRYLIPLLIALSSIPLMTADRVVTTRKHLKPTAEFQSGIEKQGEIQADTLVHPSGIIRFCGYEKTLRATRETIFIENLSDSTIAEISLTIEYLDSDGRQIHQRAIRRETNLPPRQTRRFDLKSWDTQKSYYYINGDKPRKSATPYNIKITADTLFITPCIP